MLAFIVFAVLLLVLLLAVPVGLVFALRKEHQWTGRVHLYWMFGLVRIRLRPGLRSQRRARLRLSRQQRLRRGRPGRKRSYARQFSTVLRSPGLVPRAFRLLKDLGRATRPRRLRARLVVGMEDPAETGFLAASLAPLRATFGSRRTRERPRLCLDIVPSFAGPRFRGYGCASLRFIPLQLIGLVVGFMLSRPFIHAALALRRGDGARTPHGSGKTAWRVSR
jgi:hypothetical protein